MDLIAPLTQLSAADLERAGGKGANLGELVNANLPVPPGFVLTTAGYARFVAQNRLDTTVARVLGEQTGNGAAIRDAFERAAIPSKVVRAISAAYDALGRGPVAVRSSATAEDLPEAAFAGQQETFLNVVGTTELLDAVRRCWGSLWGDRAIAYRARLKLDQQTVKLAVVVQKMVEPEFAGVMFTANPVSGARDEIVIDANPGLGEAIVSGLVTPDHFVLRKQRLGWKIAERQAGRREVVIRSRAGGGTEHVAGRDAADLPNRALRDLARLGVAIQRHFGSPQDIEWAWAEGKPFILQARPITALPEPVPHANKVQRLLAANFGEMLPIRPYPLDMGTWIPALASAVEPIFTILGLDWTLSRMFETEDDVVIRFSSKLPRPTWKTLLTPVRLVSLIRRYNPVRWQSDPLLAEAQARARELESRDVRALAWQQLVATVHAAQAIPFLAAGEVRRRYFPRAAFAIARLRVLLALAGQTKQFALLLSGAENLTVTANRALEELADRVRSDSDLTDIFSAYGPNELWAALEEQPAGRAFLVALRAFLDRYGHRESIISTALQPTWKDAPELVLGIVKSFVAHQPPLQTGQADWERARDLVLRHPLLRIAPFRSAFLELLAEARALLQIREDTHYYATLSLPLFRRTLLEFGRRLVSAGVLATPEDVFHLKLDEIEQIADERSLPPALAADLRAAMLRRKEKRAKLESTPFVDPRLFFVSAVEGDALLRGTPGSPGVAEGPARIVRDGAEFDKLGAGDVLVAPYTNPSWTPLFQRAIAVVCDSGSPASHAAIVAREYRIPAVMATVTGTQTLRDGDRIRVDGNRGIVQSAA
ncbi:MAG: phosphoenolpyruvate synthase [Chloroflexi bacterium]|nr:phosphoenolpyruvate synthase [Chloroflexota bacterium]